MIVMPCRVRACPEPVRGTRVAFAYPHSFRVTPSIHTLLLCFPLPIVHDRLSFIASTSGTPLAIMVMLHTSLVPGYSFPYSLQWASNRSVVGTTPFSCLQAISCSTLQNFLLFPYATTILPLHELAISDQSKLASSFSASSLVIVTFFKMFKCFIILLF